MFIRSKYILVRGVYNIYSIEDGSLLGFETTNTIPQDDPNIIQEPDGSYIGVFHTIDSRFIVDYYYDVLTGWFWPGNELDWGLYKNLRNG